MYQGKVLLDQVGTFLQQPGHEARGNPEQPQDEYPLEGADVIVHGPGGEYFSNMPIYIWDKGTRGQVPCPMLVAR